MDYNILLLLLLGHLLADFPLQGTSIASDRYHEKKSIRLKGNRNHTGIHLLTYFVLLLLFNYVTPQTMWIIILLSFIHFLIDILKTQLTFEEWFKKRNILLFVCDQLLHYISIFLIAYNTGLNSIMVDNIGVIPEQIYEFIGSSTYFQKILITGCLLVAGLWGAGIFINIFINYLELNFNNKDEDKDKEIKVSDTEKKDDKKYNKELGLIIGIVERLFIICVIVFKMPSLIAFGMGLKSVARFKEFDKDWFVQIFILGSFLSFISAIIVGIAIRELNIFPWITGS